MADENIFTHANSWETERRIAPTAVGRLCCRDASRGYSDDGQTMQPRIKHGMVLPFCHVTLTFKDIHYFVELPAVSPLHS